MHGLSLQERGPLRPKEETSHILRNTFFCSVAKLGLEEVSKGELTQKQCLWGEVTCPGERERVYQSLGGKKRIPYSEQVVPSCLCACSFVSTIDALVTGLFLRGWDCFLSFLFFFSFNFFKVFELQVRHLVTSLQNNNPMVLLTSSFGCKLLSSRFFFYFND